MTVTTAPPRSLADQPVTARGLSWSVGGIGLTVGITIAATAWCFALSERCDLMQQQLSTLRSERDERRVLTDRRFDEQAAKVDRLNAAYGDVHADLATLRAKQDAAMEVLKETKAGQRREAADGTQAAAR